MITQAAPQIPRFHALDGLRGIAALLVVLLHVEWHNHITGTRFVRNGYLSVDLFFILSGFVIAANYSAQIVDIPTSLRFLGLRFFRLYPLHIVMLGAFICLECCKLAAQHAFGSIWERPPFTGGESFSACVASIFLVNGLGFVQKWGWNGPSWSISCEFFAYVLFALAAMLGLIRNRIFFVGGVILSGLAYTSIALTRGTLDEVFDLGVVRCFAGFFWGVVIYRYSDHFRLRSIRYLDKSGLAFAAAVLLTMGFVSGPMIVIVIPLFVALISILIFNRGPVANILNSTPLQFLGQISYSIYMVHEFVVICFTMLLKRLVRVSFDPNIGRVVAATNPRLGDALVLCFVVVVIIVAFFTNRLVEEPSRKFGRKLLRGALRRPRSNESTAQQSVGSGVRTECS